ncbi:putative membrane protein [Halapricum desulfuricans]|uniref:Putative membrane protein n=1 Tax=Halapricum desulfuricans TaxID=2841257 RepID=A0A897NK09_9EURY|nr:DUF63 family protein [Halapricum desulfuricans]QSG12774.1 putative membrane protein [Halapricum desulfuricans]
MPLLPSGLVVPPLAHLAALIVGTVTVTAFLLALEPRVRQRHVLAFTPWMVAGAVAHGLHQLDRTVYPTWAEPLFGAPAVYVTAFVALGAVWASLAFRASLRTDEDQVARDLGVTGTVALLGLLVFASRQETLVAGEPLWSLAGVVITVPVTLGVYFGMAYFTTDIVARTRLVGGLVIFAHALDGITTAIGIDALGTGERSPLPRAIMDVAGSLPVAETIGVGWLFVVVKLALAVVLVAVFADYLEAEPTRGNLTFAAIIALGLGPAVNNVVLFALRNSGTAAAIVG